MADAERCESLALKWMADDGGRTKFGFRERQQKCKTPFERKTAIQRINKPDRAKMRPDCVSACIDHVT